MFETLGTQLGIQWETVLVGAATAVGISLTRAVLGWLEASAAKGKMIDPDFKKVIGTFFRMLPQTLFFGAFGVPVAAIGSDLALKKLTKKEK